MVALLGFGKAGGGGILGEHALPLRFWHPVSGVLLPICKTGGLRFAPTLRLLFGNHSGCADADPLIHPASSGRMPRNKSLAAIFASRRRCVTLCLFLGVTVLGDLRSLRGSA